MSVVSYDVEIPKEFKSGDVLQIRLNESAAELKADNIYFNSL